MSNLQNPYGFKYFDKPTDYKEEEEDDHEEYVDRSCPSNCCDSDCECDDCDRCSLNGTSEAESYFEAAAA